jgi:hypothetical protein
MRLKGAFTLSKFSDQIPTTATLRFWSLWKPTETNVFASHGPRKPRHAKPVIVMGINKQRFLVILSSLLKYHFENCENQ